MIRIGAETRAEIMQRLEEGYSVTEVAAMMGVSKALVWAARRGAGLSPQPPKPKKDPEQQKPCKTCHHYRTMDGHTNCCHYILDTKTARECPPEMCKELGRWKKRSTTASTTTRT